MTPVATLKADNDSAIRDKTLPDTITTDNVSDRLDALVDEHQSRGMPIVANTGALAAVAGADSNAVFVPGKGVFVFSPTGAADGIHIFAALTTGYWVQTDIVGFNFNTTGVGNIDITNTNANAGALAGIRFYNDTGIHAQLLQGSTASAYGAHTLMLHSIPGVVRLASNANDVELATGSNGTANAKLRVKNNGQVAIGSDPTPHTSAVLDVQSTTKGFLFPTMTTTQRDAIPTPANGLTIFNSTTNKINFYNGSAWEVVTSA